jgi:glycosyltransferase 2 family protein
VKKHSWILYLGGAVLLAALGWLVHTRVHFQWGVFLEQVQHLDWRRIIFGVVLIISCYYIRAARWAVLIKPQRKVSSFSLWGSQVIGFTGVALFGRPADLLRPYLVARKASLSVSSQIAVYTVERMFDLAATALIFSGALLLAPDRATLPHHDALKHGATGALLLTVALAVFAVSVRASGKAIAAIAEKTLGTLSASFGHAVANKILAFRDGLDAIATWQEAAMAMGLSLLMWAFITTAYLQTCKAFILSPQLSSMTLARCLVLMVASMAGSVIQLPVLGWFTQIGITAGVMQKIFDVQSEPALACGAMLLICTFMSVIPFGLIWARLEHVSLKNVAEQSEKLGEAAEEHTPLVSKA